VIRCSPTRLPTGFSLVELLLVLAISAILLAVALPAYRHQQLSAHRALARAELLAIQMRQAQFFIDHKRYAATLSQLGLPADTYALDGRSNRLAAEAEPRIYLISMTGGEQDYSLRATPQGSQRADDQCGVLGLDHLGQPSSQGSGRGTDCW